MEHEKVIVETAVRILFTRIKDYHPHLYGYALTVASKLDQEDWQEQAGRALGRRDELNNTPGGHS